LFQCPWSCGTLTFVVQDAELPARSVPSYVRVYVRPVPEPRRSARRKPLMVAVPTANPCMSPRPLSGSLFVKETRVKLSGPDSASDTVTEALTGTSLSLGGHNWLGTAPHIMLGGVLSMFFPLTVAGAALPARSVQAPFTVWFAPSADSTTGVGGLPPARPERMSVH